MKNEKNDTRDRTGTKTDDSRRDFMKKGALTASAVGLGLAGAGTTAAQQRDDVLVYTDDYIARTPFRIVSQLPQSITIQLLRLPNGNTVPEISQPDDYNGYAMRYSTGNQNVIGASYVFTTGTLQEDTRYRFATEANVFNGRLNLLNTTASRIGGGGGSGN
ncbi:twin-arginine translocation signal domain-containing protein [Haladaptatus sp. NG-WS-4]